MRNKIVIGTTFALLMTSSVAAYSFKEEIKDAVEFHRGIVTLDSGARVKLGEIYSEQLEVTISGEDGIYFYGPAKMVYREFKEALIKRLEEGDMSLDNAVVTIPGKYKVSVAARYKAQYNDNLTIDILEREIHAEEGDMLVSILHRINDAIEEAKASHVFRI